MSITQVIGKLTLLLVQEAGTAAHPNIAPVILLFNLFSGIFLASCTSGHIEILVGLYTKAVANPNI